MPQLQISRVMACRCAEHAWVYLDDRDGREHARIQVPIVAGRTLAALRGGRTVKHAGALDLVAATLVALDARPESVSIACADSASAQLTVSTPGGRRHVPTNVCTALLAASYLALPILLDATPPTGRTNEEVPAAFRTVLQSLDLSGLSGDG